METTDKHGITDLPDGRFLVNYIYAGQTILVGRFATKDEAHAAFTGATAVLLNRYTYFKQKETND